MYYLILQKLLLIQLKKRIYQNSIEMINQKILNLQKNSLKISLSCYINKYQASHIRQAQSKQDFFTLKKNQSRLFNNSNKISCFKQKQRYNNQKPRLKINQADQNCEPQQMKSLQRSISILLFDDQRSSSTTQQYTYDQKFSNMLKPKSINNVIQYKNKKPYQLKQLDQIKHRKDKENINIQKIKQNLNININPSFLYKNKTQFKPIISFCIQDFILSSQPIGFGTYSCVYRAIHKKSGMICAIKTLEKQKLIYLNLINNIVTQLKVMSLLGNKCQNISKLYGFFADQKYFYMIMQYATNGQLYRIVRNFKPHTNKHDYIEKLYMIRQVCKAVECMHHSNVMHRDIKPENILLNMNNQVKLTDFGWSSILSQNQKYQLRSTTCGTPLYQAPQQILKQKYNKSVDLWALGVLSFQLLTGRIPFNIISFKDLDKIVYQQIDYTEVERIPFAKQFISLLLQKNGQLRNRIYNTMSQHRIFNVVDQFDQERFVREIQFAKVV